MIFTPPDTSHGRLDLWRRTGGLLFDSIGGGGAPPVIPATNLVLWLKPDDLTGADSSAVVSCPDASGLNRHAVKLGASNPILKTNALNGKKVLQFSGAATERLGGATNLITPNVTAFLVMRIDSDSATYARGLSVTKNNATGDTVGSTNRILAVRYFGAQQVMNYGTGAEIAFAPFPSYASHFLMTSRFNGTTGYVSVNSGAEVAGAAYPWPFDAQVYAIGGDPSGTTGFKGQIAEVIMYDISLDPTKLAEVKAYLKTRFNLP